MYTHSTLAVQSTSLSSSSTTHPALGTQRRRQSRSNSLSTAHKRSASLNSTTSQTALPPSSDEPTPDAANPAAARKTTSRRRSSVAHVAADTLAGLKDGVGTLNRWSQSTTSSKASGKDTTRSRLSLAGFGSPKSPRSPTTTTQYAAASNSPTRHLTSSSSPTISPRRRMRYSPPPPHPSKFARALPPLDTLPTLLPKTYDPQSASSTNTPHSPSSASVARTPDYTTTVASDYFNAKTAPLTSEPAEADRYTSGRSRGKSGLASPPILSSDVVLKPGSNAFRPADPTPPPLPNDTIDKTRRTASRENKSHRPSDSAESMSRYDDTIGATPPRVRETRDKDKKTMLSRALAKANTAVLLDNAQNFEGAMEAYEDACRLLEQVMARSSGEEDKRKLEAIRVTYTNRIEELKNLDPTFTASSGKALPSRPMSGDSAETATVQSMYVDKDEDEPATIETATLAKIVEDPGPSLPKPSPRESLFTSTMREVDAVVTRSQQESFLLQPPPGKELQLAQDLRRPRESTMDTNYMPPPLSPRFDVSQLSNIAPATGGVTTSRNGNLQVPLAGHTRDNSEESMSWLDTIDESGGSSCGSSMHSMDEDGAVRKRKHLRLGSMNDIEAEFDAALDAAVEAAYDEGLEPDAQAETYRSRHSDVLINARSNVEAAKERVRQIEREAAISAAKTRARELRRGNELGELPHVRHEAEFDFGTSDADDEERMLEEMTKEYMLDGFDFDLQTMSALPRESDSSGISGSTWDGSRSSKRTTGPSALTNSTSASSITQIPEHPLALPPPPPIQGSPRGSGVRDRRLSGRNLGELKIDTLGQTSQQAPLSELPSIPTGAFDLTLPTHPRSAEPGTAMDDFRFDDAFQIAPNRLQVTPPTIPQPSPIESAYHQSPSSLNLTRLQSQDLNGVPPSPTQSKPSRSAMGALRKNKSSMSLKNRNLSVSSPDGSEHSVQTPTSSTFSAMAGRKTSGPVLMTPMVTTFPTDALPSGGLSLFESDIHSPFSPGSPNPLAPDAPIPLEPCPDSFLLRPFWLMRCFYQTLAHPRGGYLSTKLFVPRDVWNVKGVKLKAIEEKVAACDLLSAALMKLAQVDTYDADAVYDEISSLEPIFEQVQTSLGKRLGSEVGVGGINSLFKDAVTVGAGAGANSSEVPSAPPRSATFSATKSYLSSWRKLRSRPSGAALSSLPDTVTEIDKDSLTMSSLPMTSLPHIRFAKRELSQVEFVGPNANYMSSLARLFDAVQVLDQIARQVEDPGLKFSSQTHVGLELSTRHASEFFGFYVCRFVLSDLTALLDKFIKRGSEWVLV